jgi:hypothetical protein
MELHELNTMPELIATGYAKKKSRSRKILATVQPRYKQLDLP